MMYYEVDLYDRLLLPCASLKTKYSEAEGPQESPCCNEQTGNRPAEWKDTLRVAEETYDPTKFQ